MLSHDYATLVQPSNQACQTLSYANAKLNKAQDSITVNPLNPKSPLSTLNLVNPFKLQSLNFLTEAEFEQASFLGMSLVDGGRVLCILPALTPASLAVGRAFSGNS